MERSAIEGEEVTAQLPRIPLRCIQATLAEGMVLGEQHQVVVVPPGGRCKQAVTAQESDRRPEISWVR
jgi:hypothetical protein